MNGTRKTGVEGSTDGLVDIANKMAVDFDKLSGSYDMSTMLIKIIGGTFLVAIQMKTEAKGQGAARYETHLARKRRAP